MRFRKVSSEQQHFQGSPNFQKLKFQSKENCGWDEDLQDVKPNYPTIIKDTARFYKDMCYVHNNCRELQEVRNIAMCKAITFPFDKNTDAIYYVNTRRVQKKSISWNKEDFLSQFTFAVMPRDTQSMDDDYKPQIYTVTVPIHKQESSYFMFNCPFDFTKYKPKDLKDDKDKNCDYNIKNKDSIKMSFQKDMKQVRIEDEAEDISKTIYTQMRMGLR